MSYFSCKGRSINLVIPTKSFSYWAASSEFGTYRLCEQRRFRRARASVCAVSPEPPLLAHASSETRGTFRQKARSLAPLNGWACAVKIFHDGMLEDTDSLDGALLLLLRVSECKWFVKVRYFGIFQLNLFVFCKFCLVPMVITHVFGTLICISFTMHQPWTSILWSSVSRVWLFSVHNGLSYHLHTSQGRLLSIQHFSGHFGRGQLTYPHCFLASVQGSLPVLSVHSSVSNWQLPFLNHRKVGNDRRNYFITKR